MQSPRIPAAFLHDCLDRHARLMPQAHAIVGAHDRIDYATVAQAVTRVAFAVARRVRPGGAVAVMLPHSPWGPVGVLGVYASGRVCIVLNTNDPPARNAAILADARPELVLEEASESDRAGVPHLAPRLTLADALAAEAPPGWRPHDADGAAGMMVHFTSGSTGQPKGIATDDIYLADRSAGYAKHFRLGPGAAMATATAISANSGPCQIMAALRAGARIVLCDLTREGAGALLRLAAAERISCITGFTPVMRMLARLPAAPAAFAALRYFRIGGGGVANADLDTFRAVLPPSASVFHSYASTEANEIACWEFPIARSFDDGLIPVGFPLASHELTFLDEHGAETSPETGGELVLVSPVMACGEWRDGRLVAGRMEPVAGRPGWRRFHTGDVLRVGADGMLRFVARRDRMIKINGLRIEPGEIEAALRRDPRVTDALAVPARAGDDAPLEAFVATAAWEAPNLQAALRAMLADLLPRTMRPARITLVAEFPRLLSGKIDLARLRAGGNMGS